MLGKDITEINGFQISEYEMSLHGIKYILINKINLCFATIIKPTPEQNDKYILNFRAIAVKSCFREVTLVR